MRKKDDPIDILFNFQKSDSLSKPFSVKLNTTLPHGPEYDSYNMFIFIRIIDDLNSVSEYLISTPVNVIPFTSSNLTIEIVNEDTLSNSYKKLHQGDILEACQVISHLSIMLNGDCYQDKNDVEKSCKRFFYSYKI